MSETKKPVIGKEDTVSSFINARDLTAESFKDLLNTGKLIKGVVTLKKTTSKKGFDRFTENIVIDPMFLKVENQLPGDRYSHILLKLRVQFTGNNGMPKTEFNLPVAYRYITGKINAEGERQYKAIEIIYKQGVYNRYFFNPVQIENLNDLTESYTDKNGVVVAPRLTIDWQYQPQPLDVTETINFSNEL